MTGIRVRGDHVKLVARSYLVTSMRSGAGVIFLVVSMLIGLVLAGIAMIPIELVMEKEHDAAAALNELVKHWGPSVLGAFTDSDYDQATYLLTDHPALITLFLVMLLAFLPFLTFLAGFNQTSGDIGSKGLRYQLLRTERANIFLGRFLATYVFVVGVITLIAATVGAYTIAKVPFYGSGEVLLWLLRGWLACVLFALPWVALCAWLSATQDIPFLTLVICEIGLLVWVILVHVLQKNFEAFGYAAYATPWGWRMWLLDPSVGKVLAGFAAMLGFTGVFVWLGIRHFDKRDL
jgi:hypothetical protein